MEHQALASMTIYMALGVMTAMIVMPIYFDISDHIRHIRTVKRLKTELDTKIKCENCHNYKSQKEMFDLGCCIDCFEYAHHLNDNYVPVDHEIEFGFPKMTSRFGKYLFSHNKDEDGNSIKKS